MKIERVIIREGATESKELLFREPEEALAELSRRALFDSPHLFFIEAKSRKFVDRAVKVLRKEPESSLSPIFSNLEPTKELLRLIDGIEASITEELLEKAEKIWEVLTKLTPNPYAITLPENWRMNFLRFLLSRQIDEVEPLLKKDSVIGFFWPEAAIILRKDEAGKEWEDLELMKRQKIFTSDTKNKTSLCPFCGYYNLILREICPSCGSVKIRLEEFIHHYSCGYIGPASEFQVGDKLICPKCHEELKHIGVDYDKPLEKFTCEECKSIFTEPDLSVLCANCSKIFPPEDIKEEVINAYLFTPFGKLVATEGKFPLNVFEELSVQLGIIGFNPFLYILDKFLKLVKRYPERRFCVLGLKLIVKEEAITTAPTKVRLFLKDLVAVIKENVRSSDIISSSEKRYILILLPETLPEGAKVVAQRIAKKVEELLNLNGLTNLIEFKESYLCADGEGEIPTAEEFIKRLFEELEK
ncbi:TackOD1 domain-containing metal-binding protein [Thermovibrio sp.]